MKTLIAALALIAAGAQVYAATPPGQVNKVVRVIRQTIPVPINAQSVLCSNADYQEPMLKVLIPALAELTLLNHRNLRAGAPCVAAGVCTEKLNPETILKGGTGTDQVPVQITAVQTLTPNPAQQSCAVTLTETVQVVIRGLPFIHQRSAPLPARHIEDCR